MLIDQKKSIKMDILDLFLNLKKKFLQIDKIYQGKVVSTTNFGAFMEVLPGQDGMIHISELSNFRVDRVEDVVNVGDVIYAKCIGIDDKGRVKMSRQVAMEERGEQHLDDALREKAEKNRDKRQNDGDGGDWSPGDGERRGRGGRGGGGGGRDRRGGGGRDRRDRRD